MTPPWDWFGYGAIVGGATGMWVGYQVRIFVERYQDKRSKKREYVEAKVIRVLGPDEGVRRISRQMPDVIPLKRVRTTTPEEVTPVDRPGNPWRNDVIEALMGAGYKKAEAAKAVDSVPLPERMPGLEAWTAAALRNARKS